MNVLRPNLIRDDVVVSIGHGLFSVTVGDKTLIRPQGRPQIQNADSPFPGVWVAIPSRHDQTQAPEGIGILDRESSLADIPTPLRADGTETWLASVRLEEILLLLRVLDWIFVRPGESVFKDHLTRSIGDGLVTVVLRFLPGTRKWFSRHKAVRHSLRNLADVQIAPEEMKKWTN